MEAVPPGKCSMGRMQECQLVHERHKQEGFTLESGGSQFLTVLNRYNFFFKQCLMQEGSGGPEVEAVS